jgi:hypothetical protein
MDDSSIRPMAHSQSNPIYAAAGHKSESPIQETMFPEIQRPDSSPSAASDAQRSRGNSDAENDNAAGYRMMAGRLRSASRKFETSSIPVGMWHVTGSLASSAPSLADIRKGSYGSDGWSTEGQLKEMDRRASIGRRQSSSHGENGALSGVTEHQRPNEDDAMSDRDRHTGGFEESTELKDIVDKPTVHGGSGSVLASKSAVVEAGFQYRTDPFENGYQFPPKHTWSEATVIGLKAFWKFSITPLGFLVVLYGCNVVAWGGMLFLLLCNASPVMCSPTCNDINSPRRVWVEIDSQIINALFCVTGFGLIPWRFRDLYYLLKYRLQKDELSLRRLAGIHRNWFRLEGSSKLPITIGPENVQAESPNFPPNAVPYPLDSIPNAPLTGNRAPATSLWKLDYVIWMYVWNTFLQAVLSGIMWGLNRYNRPSWTTGLFVALACIVAALGGIMVFIEGKKIKGIEGVPVSDEDQERLKRDREMGIVHFNNLKDEKPKPKKPKKSHPLMFRRSHKAGEGVELVENIVPQSGTVPTAS